MQNQVKIILKQYFGYEEFRKGQLPIIESILKGHDVVAIMPTGGGKSICYQIPALVYDGLTIVISPLISLMKDQVDSLLTQGISAAYINSTLSEAQVDRIYEDVIHDKIKIIYVAPERLNSPSFIEVMTKIKISLIAVDEAHCVSQWGHDFRSSYKEIAIFVSSLPIRPVISAFTATATDEVKEDIISLLNLNNPDFYINGFDRENLKIIVEKGVNKKLYLKHYLKENKEQSGIIYAATRKEVEQLYEMFDELGYSVAKYHAGLSDEERRVNQESFVYDEIKIMVATNAFGMGIDKPNVRFVIHYNMPQNIEGYYQEIGRAGRDGEESQCILLFSPGDVMTQKYMIENNLNHSHRKTFQLKKLQAMTDFVYFNGCLRRYLLAYFGENKENDCQKCSHCDLTGELVDKTLDAQKVLSCVYKMQRGYGVGMLIDVLRGSANQKIKEFKLNELSTYGIMKDYSKDGLKEFINMLIAMKALDYEGEYPICKINQKSVSIIKGLEKVWMKEVKVERIKEENNELFEQLRSLRSKLAAKESIPPYMVFGDRTIKEMSTRLPQTIEQLLDISGIAQLKADKYGVQVIEVVKDYVKTHALEPNLQHQFSVKRTNTQSSQEKSYLYTFELLKENGNIAEVATCRALSINTILTHLQQLLNENIELQIPLDFSSIFTCDIEKQILSAIEAVGCEKLKPIKEIVSDTITYDQIKAVILKQYIYTSQQVN